MNKLFAGLAFLFLLGAAWAVNANYTHMLLKRHSTDDVLRTVRAIAEHWDMQALKERAAPVLADKIEASNRSGRSLEKIFDAYKQLGPLQQDYSCNTINVDIMDIPNHDVSVADYYCVGMYEKGKANIRLSLVRDDVHGEWKIIEFRVDSPHFLKPLT